jgi:hypothetical protein
MLELSYWFTLSQNFLKNGTPDFDFSIGGRRKAYDGFDNSVKFIEKTAMSPIPMHHSFTSRSELSWIVSALVK